MDAFGDDNFGEVDPAAEFLAREQNELAGLEDDLKPVTSVPIPDGNFDSPPNGTLDVGGLKDDLQDEPTDYDAVNDILDASNGFAFDGDGTNNVNVESDNIFGSDSILSMQPASDGEEEEFVDMEDGEPAPAPIKVPREEPEKIRIWREEQKKRLEEKDANEEKLKQEWRATAKKELEDWYRQHEDQIAKTKIANRNAEKEFVAEVTDIEPGTEWERIVKLCDFNPKASKSSKDVSRLRSIILHLKQNPLPRRQS